MNPELQEKIDRMESVLKVQSAEFSAMLSALQLLAERLPNGEQVLKDVNKEFLKNRKNFLQADLENLEKTQPGKAARLQELIDKSCNIFPFDYD